MKDWGGAGGSSVLNCSLSCLMRSRDERLGLSHASFARQLFFFSRFFFFLLSHDLVAYYCFFFLPPLSLLRIYIVLYSLILQPMQMEH